MENMTLYEAMTYIDKCLEEKSHEVSLDGKTTDTVHGTAARIALTKAIKHRNAINGDTKPLKKISNAGKTIADVVNGVELSNGIKKDITKADEAANKASAKMTAMMYDDSFKDPNKAMKKVSKIATSAAKKDRQLEKKIDKDIDKLRDVKRKYIPESANSYVYVEKVDPATTAYIIGPSAAGIATTAGSVVGLSKVKKAIEKTEKDLEKEEKKIKPDRTEIRKLESKLKKLKALKVGLTGTTAAGVALTGEEALRLGLGAHMAYDMHD